MNFSKQTNIDFLYKIFQKHPIVITDSRKIKAGCMFFALKGDRFDGNKFAKQAIEKGAAFAVIDEVAYQKDERFIVVENVLEALQQLANHHRRQFTFPVLGITGSNGKTTTKELLSTVLSQHYRCHYTRGNLNNHIGVPLTLLAMPSDSEIAIIEMGANHIGEIKFLCEIAAPTHGLITNIGKAHLEGFGGLEGVKKAKSELYDFLAKNDGVVFINKNENYLEELAGQVNKKVFYQKSKSLNPLEPAFEMKLLEVTPFLKVTFWDKNEKKWEAQSQLIGTYNFNNINTAASVGRYFQVPGEKIKLAIENYQPINNRSQIVKRASNTFILDAYNANPTSMKNALENFVQMTENQKVAILGDMLELGEYSTHEHLQILEQAEASSLYQVILVGEEFSKIAKERALHFENVEELKKWFDQQSFEETYFLVKGSRGIQLEKLLN